ncbi:MAG: DUF2306 domain-containing protein [Pseudooceanicola sp.]|nr:DUF2306 domain-containing protein [Pseudooceanicola sp.]
MARTSTFLFWFLCLGVALVSWRFIPLGVEAAMGFVAYHAIERPLAFFAHVGLAPVALALMPFQFSAQLRSRRPVLHRWIGRAYGLAILAAGTGGLVMALGTDAGVVAAVGFALLAVIWIGVTARGITLAMAGRIGEHRVWMIRSAALTFAAVTLRLWLPALQSVMPFEQAYTLVAWLCWVPNLLVAEWAILGRRVAVA